MARHWPRIAEQYNQYQSLSILQDGTEFDRVCMAYYTLADGADDGVNDYTWRYGSLDAQLYQLDNFWACVPSACSADQEVRLRFSFDTSSRTTLDATWIHWTYGGGCEKYHRLPAIYVYVGAPSQESMPKFGIAMSESVIPGYSQVRYSSDVMNHWAEAMQFYTDNSGFVTLNDTLVTSPCMVYSIDSTGSSYRQWTMNGNRVWLSSGFGDSYIWGACYRTWCPTGTRISILESATESPYETLPDTPNLSSADNDCVMQTATTSAAALFVRND